MFLNGLRSRRGKLELVSRFLITGAFVVGGFGGFSAAIGLAWYFVKQNHAELIALLLWPMFFFWQVFPVMATAFTSNPDSSELLRFPLNYRSYFLIRLAYGSFDPASALGSAGLLGVLIGITVARPLLFPWSLLVFAWLERWLAQRRTREIMGVVFILFMLSFQLIGPIMEHFGNRPRGQLEEATHVVTAVQKALPPGYAANAIAANSEGRYGAGFASLLLLVALTLVIAYLLHLRLHAQFLGENLSEAAARSATTTPNTPFLGWKLPGLPQSVTAVFEKEMRYLGRSGPMLLTLIMPVFMLLIFRLGPMNPMRRQPNFLHRAPDMAFPASVAYSLLVLTNLVYNSFGGDSGGIQFFYASPVQFRQIVLAKNLTHTAILALNVTMAWIAVRYFYGAPDVSVTIATLVGLLFAAPLNFTAGNLMSVYSPRKRDFSTFGRQNVAQITVLASLGVQVVIVAAGAAAFTIARMYQNFWIAGLIFLALAAISMPLYFVVLGRLDHIALNRREALLAELCRA